MRLGEMFGKKGKGGKRERERERHREVGTREKDSSKSNKERGGEREMRNIYCVGVKKR